MRDGECTVKSNLSQATIRGEDRNQPAAARRQAGRLVLAFVFDSQSRFQFALSFLSLHNGQRPAADDPTLLVADRIIGNEQIVTLTCECLSDQQRHNEPDTILLVR